MPDSFSPVVSSLPAWRDRFLANFRRRGWRGFIWLYNFLKSPKARRELRVVTRYGSQFYLVPGDAVDSHVILEGFYESEVLEAIRPALGPGSVLWVVGANFGLHAITAKFLHPATTVVAFEPSPAIGARIIENCALNGVTLDLHAYALSDRAGALPFFANASGNPGMSTLHPCDAFTYDHKFVVATFTAGDVIERGLAPAPTAMILDAEGAELDVLRGFGPHLANPSLKAFVFETDNDFLTHHQPAELHALVTAAGFRVTRLDRRETTAHALSNFAAFRA